MQRVKNKACIYLSIILPSCSDVIKASLFAATLQTVGFAFALLPIACVHSAHSFEVMRVILLRLHANLFTITTIQNDFLIG